MKPVDYKFKKDKKGLLEAVEMWLGDILITTTTSVEKLKKWLAINATEMKIFTVKGTVEMGRNSICVGIVVGSQKTITTQNLSGQDMMNGAQKPILE